MLRKTSKPTTLNQSRYAHRGATATLNVSPVPSGNRVIDLHPDGSGADCDSWLRTESSRAALRHECIMYCDVVEVTRPNQKRIRSVRSALITVAAAFYGKAQTVLSCEGHSARDVMSIPCRDRVNTRARGPRLKPSQCLSKSWLIADIKWIA